MRVLLDGTPLLGPRTGIGRYTAALAAELAALSDVDVRAVGFTARGHRELRSAVPPGVRAAGIPAPARALRAAWRRVPFPPVELLAGRGDVVHGTNFALPPSLRAGGVVTVHDLAFLDIPADAPDPGFAELVRRSAHRADVVCAPSEAVAAAVRERLRVPRERIAVTPLGVDPEWFTAEPPGPELRRLGLPDEYYVFIGASGPRKGLDVLLRAHGADLPPLVVAGPGAPTRARRVLRTGYLPEAELRSVVAGARALVLPSRDEGFGLPVLEALACGVPVVCSDLPALREVAGGLATFVPPGDPDALRAALREATGRAGSGDQSGRPGSPASSGSRTGGSGPSGTSESGAGTGRPSEKRGSGTSSPGGSPAHREPPGAGGMETGGPTENGPVHGDRTGASADSDGRAGSSGPGTGEGPDHRGRPGTSGTDRTGPGHSRPSATARSGTSAELPPGSAEDAAAARRAYAARFTWRRCAELTAAAYERAR